MQDLGLHGLKKRALLVLKLYFELSKLIGHFVPRHLSTPTYSLQLLIVSAFQLHEFSIFSFVVLNLLRFLLYLSGQRCNGRLIVLLLLDQLVVAGVSLKDQLVQTVVVLKLHCGITFKGTRLHLVVECLNLLLLLLIQRDYIFESFSHLPNEYFQI